ncbi:MAG: transposase [Flavobacteriales bacterium]
MVTIFMHAALFVANGRKPFDDSLSGDVKSFVKSVFAYKGIHCEDVCVQSDHLHVLLRIPAHRDVFEALKILRYWLQDFVERNSTQPPFEWQERFWLVSKSPPDLEAVRKYFRRQPEYHTSHTIGEEWDDMMDLEEMDGSCND